MIVRVFVLLALLLLVFWGLNSLTKRYAFTKQQGRLLLLLCVVLTTVIVLIVMGRLPIQFIVAPIGVAATFLLRMLPTALRLLPLWQMLKSRTQFDPARSSKRSDRRSVIRTEFLAMELQHQTGDLDGSVLKGQFSGQRLSSMSLEQLLELARQCVGDTESLQVLEAYLDRMHRTWREEATDKAEATGTYEESAMSRELALEILGLTESANKDDIAKAHRKLMQKMHPDRGGTDYLAKKINAAKDYLLDHL